MTKSAVNRSRPKQAHADFCLAVGKAGSVTKVLRTLNAHPAFASVNRATLYRWRNDVPTTPSTLGKILFAIKVLTGKESTPSENRRRIRNIALLKKRSGRLTTLARQLQSEAQSLARLVGKMLVVLLVCVPSLSRADTVSFFLGDQLARQGGAVEGNLSVGPIVFVPWATLDGDLFEGMPMVKYQGSKHLVTVGPLLGSINNAVTGGTPYFGGEVRGRVALWHSTLHFRLAQRNTKEAMLNRLANIGLEAGTPTLAMKVSYQPIERSNVVTHRLALKASAVYMTTKLGLEVRTTLDRTTKKSAVVDVTIPFGRKK